MSSSCSVNEFSVNPTKRTEYFHNLCLRLKNKITYMHKKKNLNYSYRSVIQTCVCMDEPFRKFYSSSRKPAKILISLFQWFWFVVTSFSCSRFFPRIARTVCRLVMQGAVGTKKRFGAIKSAGCIGINNILRTCRYFRYTLPIYSTHFSAMKIYKIMREWFIEIPNNHFSSSFNVPLVINLAYRAIVHRYGYALTR